MVSHIRGTHTQDEHRVEAERLLALDREDRMRQLLNPPQASSRTTHQTQSPAVSQPETAQSGRYIQKFQDGLIDVDARIEAIREEIRNNRALEAELDGLLRIRGLAAELVSAPGRDTGTGETVGTVTEQKEELKALHA